MNQFCEHRGFFASTEATFIILTSRESDHSRTEGRDRGTGSNETRAGKAQRLTQVWPGPRAEAVNRRLTCTRSVQRFGLAATFINGEGISHTHIPGVS